MPSNAAVNDYRNTLDEIYKQTDRGAAIIAASVLDDILSECLKKRLILSKSTENRLFDFDRNGPLASFSSRIDLAFAVGILTETQRDDLHLMRRIRNRFAHHLHPIDFNDKEVGAYCKTFSCCKEINGWKKLPNLRKFTSAFTLIFVVMLIMRYRTVRIDVSVIHGLIENATNVVRDRMSARNGITAEELSAVFNQEI